MLKYNTFVEYVTFSRSADCCSLLCLLASTAQYLMMNSVEVGLRQRYIGWPPCQLTRSSKVRAQRWSSANRWSALLGSHHRHSCQFQLALYSRAN